MVQRAWTAAEHSVKQDDNRENAEQIVKATEISFPNSRDSYLRNNVF